MKFKRLFLGVSMLFLAAFLTGCGEKKEEEKDAASAQETKTELSSSSSNSSSDVVGSFVTNGVVEDQLEKPKKDEEIAVFTVKDYGTIKCRLFPQAAPVAVNTFKELAKAKKYDGNSFHRVIADFMIQAGKEAEEKGGVKKTQVELNRSLHHLNGALCMARNQSKTDGQSSQFYIVSSEAGKKADFDVIKNTINAGYRAEGLDIQGEFDEKTIKQYRENGGRPDLDMMYTVFGQVFEGQDVVDKIASCPKKEESQPKPGVEPKSEPKDPVIIEKVEITKA